uniref:WW domain-containing protein n=1 Tax=Arion vulgaris TaxID=1028688 RepID=A0A0B6YMY5_9EUPU
MAAASGKGGAKWIPALPHGWEAKYDVDNKAYFFIDHVNKKTQWDDPRFPKPAQRAHPPTQAASAVAASVR